MSEPTSVAEVVSSPAVEIEVSSRKRKSHDERRSSKKHSKKHRKRDNDENEEEELDEDEQDQHEDEPMPQAESVPAMEIVPSNVLEACDALIQAKSQVDEKKITQMTEEVKGHKKKDASLRKAITNFLKKEGKGRCIVLKGIKFELVQQESKANPVKQDYVTSFLFGNIRRVGNFKSLPETAEFVKEMYSEKNRGIKAPTFKLVFGPCDASTL